MIKKIMKNNDRKLIERLRRGWKIWWDESNKEYKKEKVRMMKKKIILWKWVKIKTNEKKTMIEKEKKEKGNDGKT